MPTPKLKSVDEYLASQPAATRAVLERVRATILKALPRAEETLTYHMPTYQLGGVTVIYFAGWKKHYALYPASKPVIAALATATEPHTLAKSTVRFTYAQAFPAKLITRIAKLRATEMAAKMPK